MPANLPAEAKSKWKKVMDAKTPEEKLQALQEFLSAVPKHKGTERLRMQVTRQIAALKREIEERKKKKVGSGEHFFVEKEGDIQLVILGFPGSGKTSLFRCLTGKEEQAISSRKPVPGILTHNGVYFQVVDTPPILSGSSSGKLLALARNADALILAIDPTLDVYSQLDYLLRLLEGNRITVERPTAIVEIERRAMGGITIIGDLTNATTQDVISLLREYSICHAVVRIWGRATLDYIEEAVFGSYAYKPAVIVLTKVDLLDENALKSLGEKLRAAINLPVHFFTNTNCGSLNVEEVVSYIFRELNLIKVYTRNPKTGEVEKRPVVIRRGAKVIDVAKKIHSDLYKNFKYARIWSPRLVFSPQKVGREFVLEDGDIIEIVS
jgi:ribosome-interacting GTPase 1